MLLKIFTAPAAAATVLNIVRKGAKNGALRTAGYALMKFSEYYLATVLAYVTGVYAVTELTVDIDKPQDKPSKFWQWNLGEMADVVRKACNIKVELTGAEKLPQDGRYLIVSNHRSLFDPVTTAAVFRKENYIFISKASNFKIPIAGKVMHKCCCMQLNRENNREALGTIKRACKFINDDVASVIIYPEGTRGREDGLLPFHPGSFKIAQKAGVPVVPMAVSNTDKVKHNAPFKRTTVHIDIADVIDAEFVKTHTTKETAELAHTRIQEKLDIERNK